MSSRKPNRVQATAAALLEDVAVTVLPYGSPPFVVGRLVLADDAASRDFPASESLHRAISAIDELGASLEYLATPAGFHVAGLPAGWSGASGWRTSEDDFALLVPTAEVLARRLVHDAGAHNGQVRYVSLGIDLRSASRDHVEAAVLYDTNADAVIGLTAKSYPTLGQERTLIRNSRLQNHFLAVGAQKVATLVCHDLSIFNPRGRAVRKGQRDAVGDGLAQLLNKFRPTIALHLAHTVATPGTWRSALAKLADENPSLRGWTTAFRYMRLEGYRPDAPITRELLAATRGGPASGVDVVVASSSTTRLLSGR